MRLILGQLFAQQVHVSELKPILLADLTPAGQKYILDQLVASKAPPKYQYRILALVVSASTEVLIDDISDAYAEMMVAAMHPRASRGDSRSPVIYRWANHDQDYEVVINEERDVLVQAGGTGYRTWEAALALGDFFIVHPELLKGSWLELGAGTGFVSMVLNKLGTNCIATDGDEEILERMDDSLEKRYIWWGEPQNDEKYNIVAADVLYDPSIFPAFFQTVKDLVGPDMRAYVATTIRNPDTYAHLPIQCEKLGLRYRVVATYNAENESQWFYLGKSVVEIVEICI